MLTLQNRDNHAYRHKTITKSLSARDWANKIRTTNQKTGIEIIQQLYQKGLKKLRVCPTCALSQSNCEPDLHNMLIIMAYYVLNWLLSNDII